MPATVVLVRHADAVVPTRDGPAQVVRPLTERGRAQAEALVGQLPALAPAAIASSPYRQAIQTVEPVSAGSGCQSSRYRTCGNGIRASSPPSISNCPTGQRGVDPTSG